MFSPCRGCPLGDCCCCIHVCLLCDLRAGVSFCGVEIWVVAAYAFVTDCGDNASSSVVGVFVTGDFVVSMTGLKELEVYCDHCSYWLCCVLDDNGAGASI